MLIENAPNSDILVAMRGMGRVLGGQSFYGQQAAQSIGRKGT